MTIQNPDAPASPKQIDFIRDLLDKNGFDRDGFDFDDPPLTKGEAHGWIDALKAGRLPEGVSDPNA